MGTGATSLPQSQAGPMSEYPRQNRLMGCSVVEGRGGLSRMGPGFAQAGGSGVRALSRNEATNVYWLGWLEGVQPEGQDSGSCQMAHKSSANTNGVGMRQACTGLRTVVFSQTPRSGLSELNEWKKLQVPMREK